MEKRILSLDASTKASGYAIYRSKGEKIEYGLISSSSQCLEKRITIMREGIIKLIKKNNIDTVIIEDVRLDGFSTATARALLWLQGCLSVAIWEENPKIEIIKIGPSSWRKVLGLTQGRGITRDKQKQIDIKYAEEAFNVTLSPSQDDEGDALCILAAYLKDANELVSPQQATRSAAIGEEESAF